MASSETPFQTEAVRIAGTGNETSDPVRVPLPAQTGRIQTITVTIPTGNAGIVVEMAFRDRDTTDLSDFDALDPHLVRFYIDTGTIAYVGATNPPGPKATKLLPDAFITLNGGLGAIVNTRDQDKHAVAVRVTGATQAWTMDVSFGVLIQRG